MLETILGDKKVVLGSKSANVVLESLGKIYLKFGNKTRVLNDLFDSITSTETDTTKKTIIVKTQSEFDELEYPGDGYFVYLASSKILYFSYLNDYIQLINLESSGYLTNPLNETLEINTAKVPLKVVSSKLVENLNVEQLNGYRDYNFAKKAEDETINGKWLFNGQNRATDTWTFDKHLAIGGSLISKNGFASGYSGHGWMLDASTNTLTIDNLIVRKILSVYELVVNKISATNGSLWISNAGKVSEVYFINTFLDDIISQQNVVTLQNNETTTKDFIDYTGVVITDEHLSPTPDFEFNSALLYSTDFTKDVLETRKLILNQNNLREYLYLYYSYFNGFFYLIKLDEEGQNYPPFKVGDLLRCQKYSSGNIKYYDAIVVNTSEDSRYYTIRLAGSVLDNYSDVIIDEEGNITAVDNSTNALSDSTINTNIVEVDIPYTNTDGVLVTEENTGTLTLPTKDDGLVQMGSIINDNRKNAIYITSSDDRAPYIDILSGIDRPDYSVVIREIKTIDGVEVVETSDLLKCRLGNLSGIYEPSFKIKQPHGFGLYSNNVFLKGEFYLENGDTLVNFDENKIYLAYKNAGLEISDNSLGEPTLKLFGDQIEFWSGKSDSVDSTKLMSLTSLFNSDGSKINDSLINADGILALLDVNGIIQSKGLIIKTTSSSIDWFNNLVQSSVIFLKSGTSWVREAVYPYIFNTRTDFIAAITAEGTTYNNKIVKIINGLDLASKGETETYNTPSTTKITNTYKTFVLVNQQGSSYSYTTVVNQLADFTVDYVIESDWNLPAASGNYLFLGMPIGGWPKISPQGTDLVTINNIYTYNSDMQYFNIVTGYDIINSNLSTKSDIGCYISPDGKLFAKGAEIQGTIEATSGTIGSLNINNLGLYVGNPDKWTDTTYNQNLFHLIPGTLKLQRTYGYGGQQYAGVKVGIGADSDPSPFSTESGAVASAGYFYRQGLSWEGDGRYIPAVKIVSDNVINRDVALYTKGAAIITGGLLETGHFNSTYYDSVHQTYASTRVDLSFGTTIVLNSIASNLKHYLPTLADLRQQLCIKSTETTTKFAVPITLIAQRDSWPFYVVFENGENLIDWNGNSKSVELSEGDVMQLALIWDGTTYYGQITNLHQ